MDVEYRIGINPEVEVVGSGWPCHDEISPDAMGDGCPNRAAREEEAAVSNG